MADKSPTLRQNLRIAPVQKLALTPALLQKIELLKLSHLELSDFVKTEMLQNPMLEEASPDGGGGDFPETGDAPDAGPPDEARVRAEAEADGSWGEPDGDAPPSPLEDLDYTAFFEEYLEPGYRAGVDYEDYERPGFESFAVRPTSLYEHLLGQLELEDLPPVVEAVARVIIGNLNPEGFLQATPAEVAESARELLAERGLDRPVTPADIETAHQVLGQFDPTGVGARDLRECLLAQLTALGEGDSLAYRILDLHAEAIENRDLDRVAELTGHPLTEITAAMARIGRLDPKPGLRFGGEETVYIQPDVYITKSGSDYLISLNEDGLPRLRISPHYRRLLQRGGSRGEERRFLREKLHNAFELIRNLDQRKRTIYRVCEIIVRNQREFLERGPASLKPMLLRDVADELGLHTSTVSRTVTSKWVHSPQGIMELRRFFTLGFRTDVGEDISVHRLKQRIAELIRAESPDRPLSDSDLTGRLNAEGIDIKRRTVAKYREEMDIPNSRDRRSNPT